MFGQTTPSVTILFSLHSASGANGSALVSRGIGFSDSKAVRARGTASRFSEWQDEWPAVQWSSGASRALVGHRSDSILVIAHRPEVVQRNETGNAN